MPQVKEKMKYRFKTFYDKLSRRQARLLRAMFCRTLNQGERMFYTIVKGESEPSVKHLLFFAQALGKPMEDFIETPLLVRPLEEEEKVGKQELAKKLGLSK